VSTPIREVPVLVEGDIRFGIRLRSSNISRKPSDARGWPADGSRGYGAGLCAPKCLGFPALPQNLSMNVRRFSRGVPAARSARDRTHPSRLAELPRAPRNGRPVPFRSFLCSDPCTRGRVALNRYSCPPPRRRAYCDAMLALPPMQEWRRPRYEPKRCRSSRCALKGSRVKILPPSADGARELLGLPVADRDQSWSGAPEEWCDRLNRGKISRFPASQLTRSTLSRAPSAKVARATRASGSTPRPSHARAGPRAARPDHQRDGADEAGRLIDHSWRGRSRTRTSPAREPRVVEDPVRSCGLRAFCPIRFCGRAGDHGVDALDGRNGRDGPLVRSACGRFSRA